MAIPLTPTPKPSPPPRIPCAVRAFLLLPSYPTETELLHMRLEYKRHLQTTTSPTSCTSLKPTPPSSPNPATLASLPHQIFTEQNFYLFFHQLSLYRALLHTYVASGGRIEPMAGTVEKVFDCARLVAGFLERRKELMVEEWEGGLKLRNRVVERERVFGVFARSERWDLLAFEDLAEVKNGLEGIWE